MWASPLRALGTVAILVVVAGGAVLMILPFYWMLVTALSPATDVMAFPPKWIPSRVTLEHLWYALQKAPWHLYYWNSLVVAVVSVGFCSCSGSSRATRSRSTASRSRTCSSSLLSTLWCRCR